MAIRRATAVPRTQKHVNVVMVSSIQERIVEETVSVVVPRIQEQIVEVIKMILLERVSEHIVEQIADSPIPRHESHERSCRGDKVGASRANSGAVFGHGC